MNNGDAQPRRGLEALNAIIERARGALGIDAKHEMTVADLARAELARERLERLELRRRRLASLGHPLPISVEMQAAIIRNELISTAAVRAAFHWAQHEKRRVLILAGTTGSGKSVAAAALCSRANAARWISATSLAALYLSDHYETVERRHWLHHAKLLVIDGLGDELRDRAPHVTEALLDQIAHRSAGRTIITTRHNWPGLTQRYASEPLFSLLAQTARLEQLQTPDLRTRPEDAPT